MGKQTCCDGSYCVRVSLILQDGTSLITRKSPRCKNKTLIATWTNANTVNVCLCSCAPAAEDRLVSNAPRFPWPRSRAASALSLKTLQSSRQPQMNSPTWGDGGGLMVVQTQKSGSTVCPGGLLERGGGRGVNESWVCDSGKRLRLLNMLNMKLTCFQR